MAVTLVIRARSEVEKVIASVERSFSKFSSSISKKLGALFTLGGLYKLGTGIDELMTKAREMQDFRIISEENLTTLEKARGIVGDIKDKLIGGAAKGLATFIEAIQFQAAKLGAKSAGSTDQEAESIAFAEIGKKSKEQEAQHKKAMEANAKATESAAKKAADEQEKESQRALESLLDDVDKATKAQEDAQEFAAKLESDNQKRLVQEAIDAEKQKRDAIKETHDAQIKALEDATAKEIAALDFVMSRRPSGSDLMRAVLTPGMGAATEAQERANLRQDAKFRGLIDHAAEKEMRGDKLNSRDRMALRFRDQENAAMQKFFLEQKLNQERIEREKQMAESLKRIDEREAALLKVKDAL